jgi:hypothetical protein
MVRLAAATPLEVLSDRKVQIESIRRRFPALARLPLARDIDQRSYRLGEGPASAWTRVAERARDSLSWRLHKWFDLREKRHFVKTFNFDGTGWRALRDLARESAGQVDSLLNQDVLLQLIPPSSLPTKYKRLITDATGRKTLIGAVLFCRQFMENNE